MAHEASQHQGLPGYQLTMVLLVNPDGYQYTRDKDRMWRKNRDDQHPKQQLVQSIDGTNKVKSYESPAVRAASMQACVGVDLNRNWPTHWGKTMVHGQEVSDTPKPCSETFLGFGPGQEPEVVAVTAH